jgi:hypothetical protein
LHLVVLSTYCPWKQTGVDYSRVNKLVQNADLAKTIFIFGSTNPAELFRAP